MRRKIIAPIHDFTVDGAVHPQSFLEGEILYGERVRIHAFASIGTQPFIFRLNKDRRREPHLGRFGVAIGNDVEIFPRANIDAGSERFTVIGDRVKIDHYAHIGHDSVVGEDTVVTGGVVVCGFVRIGARCTIGANAVIKQEVSIGDDCMIGAGAVVVCDIPSNTCVLGSPAHHSYRQNWEDLPWEDPDW
jgi:UDP-3-O-[3-hydroxymyristoyl] glucosamine N-acyltransferase